MSLSSVGFDRRTFLIGLGLTAGAGATLMGVGADRAHALASKVLVPADWRRALADQYFATGAPFAIKPLQDGLEVWEAAGYMVVDTSRQSLLEGSATAISPYRAAVGDLAYLGPATYLATSRGVSRALLTGRSVEPREAKAIGLDAAAMMRETLQPAQAVAPAGSAGVVTSLVATGGGLIHLKAGEAKSRVPLYGNITSCTVYPNSAGICGWVAGSIVTRYWHAGSTAKVLLPSAYRTSTYNMTTSPNFATYLQGSSGNSSWARDVKDRLIWNATKQGVSHSAAWALGNIGMFNDVRDGKPVIVFGNIPIDTTGNLGAHAVVAYGETNGGYLITHYGWSGYTDIVLNAGLAGSNTKFKLT